ncbi:MAG TPA: copper resistance protein CopC [Capillimicrobium sp.]|nr:copper resistance protein CopC [Capillimicrobium sp.]
MSAATAGVWRRASARRLVAACLLAAAVTVAWAGDASAHAVLTHTAPHQNASVEVAPARVQLDFNEPVEVSFGAVRVYDERGERVDTGEVEHVPGRPSSVEVGLRPGLGRGIYTATYRVVSADGHPVSGGYAFGVGEAVTAQRATPDVVDLLARSSAGAFVEGAYGVARGVQYAALLLLVGAVVFRLAVWPRRAEARWPWRLLLGAALVGLAASAAGIALQGLLAAGLPVGHVLDASVLEGSLSTRTGEAWLLRACAWAFVAVFVALYRESRSRAEIAGLALPAALLVASLPYAGHADTQSPQAVLIPADVVHVVAAGAWLGGLVLLVVCFWRRRDGAGTADAVAATGRFSRLALPAMLALVAAGAVQAWFYLGSVGAFVESTYGWALLAKIALVCAIVALASRSRGLTARLVRDGDATARLRASMLGEVALAVLVLAPTATLVRAAPPATVAAGPVIRELELGPMQLQLDIEPGTVGPNDYHLYLFDRRTGAQIDRVRELTVRLVQREKGIGPITLDIPRKGPAHYELRNSTLGVAGTWEATITARVSRFDEYSGETEFEVRP